MWADFGELALRSHRFWGFRLGRRRGFSALLRANARALWARAAELGHSKNIRRLSTLDFGNASCWVGEFCAGFSLESEIRNLWRSKAFGLDGTEWSSISVKAAPTTIAVLLRTDSGRKSGMKIGAGIGIRKSGMSGRQSYGYRRAAGRPARPRAQSVGLPACRQVVRQSVRQSVR